MSDNYSFSTDSLLSIIKILSTTSVNGKYMRLPNQTRPIGKKLMVNRWHLKEYSQNTILELNHFTKSHTNIY